MNDSEMLLLRDGNEHQIGPLTLRYEGLHDSGPEGVCTVKTEQGTTFTLDWMDAEAIAFCIAPCARLWGAYDSDREPRGGSLVRRGWLRLKLTAEEERLGSVTGWAGSAFQIARLVTAAGRGKKVEAIDKGRTTDYRRSNLRTVGGAAKADTRTSFLHATKVLARHLNPDLPAGWEAQAKARWWAADEAHRIAGEMTEAA